MHDQTTSLVHRCVRVSVLGDRLSKETTADLDICPPGSYRYYLGEVR